MRVRVFMCAILSAWFCISGSALAGSAMLTWTNPTTNENGSPLTDLQTIRIYQGLASGQYDQQMDVGMTISASLSGLTEGQTYFWAVTAVDASGNESVWSNEGSKTIPVTPSQIRPLRPWPSQVQSMEPWSKRKTTVRIMAEALDNVGVDRVLFLIDGDIRCQDGGAPYTCMWNVPAPPNRRYALTAIAVDGAGNQGQSLPVVVTSER